LYTDKLNVYSKLPDNNYLESALIIDDTGVVRLQGISGNSSNTDPSLNNPSVVILKSNPPTLNDLVEVHQKFSS
jgi:hypothetical protein